MIKQLKTVWINEWKVFFRTPLAMILVPLYLVLCASYFYGHLDTYLTFASPSEAIGRVKYLSVMNHLVVPFFRDLMMVLVFVIPLMTMRTFAEEKRMGTYELLISYPVRPVIIILGKYLGLSSLALCFLLATGIFSGLVFWYGEPHTAQMFSIYLGYSLFILWYVAIGIVASLFTENQLIAAVVTYLAFFVSYIIKILAFVSTAPFDQVFSNFLIISHLDSFRGGLIFLGDIVVMIGTTTFVLLIGYAKLRRHFFV